MKDVVLSIFSTICGLILIIIVVISMFSDSSAIKENDIKEVDPSTIIIWTDEETGVQYVIFQYKKGYAGMGGITPRLNADGTLCIESEDNYE